GDTVAALQQQKAAAEGRIADRPAEVAGWLPAGRRVHPREGRRKPQTRRGAATAERQTGGCTTANGKLIAVANDILHLYHAQGFRALLLESYEPLLGFKKVELENMVQDYEDKIDDQRQQPGAPAAAVPVPAGTGA
ncbi:MAG: hypothetical protein ACHQIO_20450, partial [Nevskiales bacterium]